MVQNILCRQNNLYDVKTGKLIKTLNDFSNTRQFVTTAITNNEKYILIGENLITRMFEIESGEELVSFQGTTIPSKFVITDDDTKAYVGYSHTCLFKVFDINLESESFGEVLFLYDYQQAFPDLTLEGAYFGRELAEISVSSRDNRQLLLNIRRCYLILLDLASGASQLVDMNAVHVDEQTFLFSSKFSAEGEYIVAGNDRFLHVWKAHNGSHISTIKVRLSC